MSALCSFGLWFLEGFTCATLEVPELPRHFLRFFLGLLRLAFIQVVFQLECKLISDTLIFLFFLLVGLHVGVFAGVVGARQVRDVGRVKVVVLKSFLLYALFLIVFLALLLLPGFYAVQADRRSRQGGYLRLEVTFS